MAFSEKVTLVVDVVTGSARSGIATLKSDLKQTEGLFNKAKVASNGLLNFVGTTGPLAWAAMGTAALKAGQVTVNAAMNLNEEVSKTEAVFGDSAGAIKEWADGAAEGFGQSKTQAMQAASTFGNLFSQLGIGTDAAAGMSKSLTELASDFASFFNTDPAQAIDAITAAFRGEYDAVQRFVPTINAAAVQQKALSMGLADSTSALTEQDKALAAYELIITGAGEAAGDFDRTQDSLANRSRVLKSQLADLQAEIGQGLLPAVTSAAGAMTDLLGAVDALTGPLGGLGGALDKLINNAPLFGNAINMTEIFESNASGVDRFGAAIGGIIPPLGNFVQGLDGVKINGVAANQTVGELTVGVQNLSGSLEAGKVSGGGWGQTLKDKADQSAAAVKNLNFEWQALKGQLSDQSAALAVEDAFAGVEDAAVSAMNAAANGEANAAGEARRHQGAVIALKERVLQYGQEILKLPPKKVSDILALIDQGKLAEARSALDDVARSRQAFIDVRVANHEAAAAALADLARNRTAYIRTVVTGGATGAEANRFVSGARAGGGMVMADGIYRMGESGPEMVHTDASGRGRVIPAGTTERIMGGGSGRTAIYNINVNVAPGAESEAGRKIVQTIKAYERSNGTAWRN